MNKKAPMSRELRLANGIFHGELEQLAFDIYTGDAGTLGNSMAKLELIVELRESRAIDGLAHLIKLALRRDGYIVDAGVDEAVYDWHEDDILGIAHEVKEPS